MSFENYEGTAIDTSILQEVQHEPVAQQTEVVVDNPTPADPQNIEGDTTEAAIAKPKEETVVAEQEEAPTEFEIPGVGKLTVEEIKELRQGSLRQSDYTRKTQELARQREELQNAENLFNYLKSNPHLVAAMKEAETNPNSVIHTATPENEMLQKLAYNQKAMEVDMKLNELRGKYGEIDEIALFKKATELHTDDLEFVYKGLRYENASVDVNSIVAQAKEAAKAELKAELEANKTAVSTNVDTRQTQPVNVNEPLTTGEKRVAEAMGMSEEEYRKWR